MSESDTETTEILNPHRDVPILLLAGGAGIRMKVSPDRKLASRPKPLVPLADGSILIDMVLTGLTGEGFKRLYLLTRAGNEAQGERIEKYVKRGHGVKFGREGISVEFSKEVTPLGTAGAVRKAIADFSLESTIVIFPTDTAFPSAKLLAAIEEHSIKKSQFTFVVTDAPGENTQNVGKILADGESGAVKYDLESGGEIPSGVDLKKYKYLTSVGVLIVSAGYFKDKYAQMVVQKPELQNKNVDLYRDFIPFLLSEGEIVDTYDIHQPAPDLGTPERLRDFGNQG